MRGTTSETHWAPNRFYRLRVHLPRPDIDRREGVHGRLGVVESVEEGIVSDP
jgi:hypothetical protein